jgi:hypothetical protein
MRIKRRRVRNVRPEVLRAIHQELLTGSSSPQVYRALEDLQHEGSLPQGSIPSERTISNIAKEMRTDASGAWTLADADARTVALVLHVLAEVARRTEGRITSLTRAEAALIPVMYRATSGWLRKLSPSGRFWQSYVGTRFYLSWVRTDRDAHDATLLYAALLSKGKWPPQTWLRHIERVNDAMGGWLPPELSEVER